MTTNRLVIGLVAAWAALMVVSFVHPFVFMADGEGAAFKRLVVLLNWQGLAFLPGVVALAMCLANRELPAPPVRIIGCLPTLGYVAEFGLYQMTLMFR